MWTSSTREVVFRPLIGLGKGDFAEEGGHFKYFKYSTCWPCNEIAAASSKVQFASGENCFSHFLYGASQVFQKVLTTSS